MYKGIISIFHPDCIPNQVDMGNCEMADIIALPTKLYTTNPDKFVLIYALDDGWVDRRYHQEFRQNFPQIDTVVEESIGHCWVESQTETEFIAHEMVQRLTKMPRHDAALIRG